MVFLTANVAYEFQRRIKLFHRALCFCQHDRPGKRQIYFSVVADEKRSTKGFLHILNLSCQCRGRDPKLRSRSSKTSIMGNAQEITKVTKIHDPIVIRKKYV